MAPRVTEAYKRQRRQEIIKAARNVFWRIGYTQTVMQDVIEETGLSRGAVYDYFSNKDDLFRAVIEDGDEQARERFAALQQAVPLWPKLSELILSTEHDDIYQAESAGGIRAHIEYVVTHSRNPQHFGWMKQRYEWFVAAYQEAFQAAVERGELQPILPLDTIARFVISAVDGMYLGVMVGGAKFVQLADQTQTLMEFLMYSLGPARPSPVRARPE